jgi:hypothetical protein
MATPNDMNKAEGTEEPGISIRMAEISYKERVLQKQAHKKSCHF